LKIQQNKNYTKSLLLLNPKLASDNK